MNLEKEMRAKKNDLRYLNYLLFSTLFLFMLSGCSKLTTGVIHRSRTDYNMVLQRTDNEQLLLNLVRLRYRDRPFFLETSSISSQFVFSPKLRADLSAGTALSGSISGDVGYEERPTVSYTPLQGESFLQRVMSPVSWETIELLDNVGWRSDRVMRICIQRFNRLGNAVTASGPTPALAPPYKHFLEAIELYRKIKDRGMVRTFVGKIDDREAQVMEFDKEILTDPDYKRLMKLLRLNASKERYEVLYNISRPTPNSIHFETRSFSGILFFLSQSVLPPQRDIDSGLVTVTYDRKGNIFDWNNVTRDLLVIFSSDKKPGNAAVSVHYRGSWFYIDDSDLNSKSTFVLLGQLFALQAGKIKHTEPILTLPIGK